MKRLRTVLVVLVGCSSPLTIAELRREGPSLVQDGGIDNTDEDADAPPPPDDPTDPPPDV